MTRTGCICMIAVMALAAFGILFGRGILPERIFLRIGIKILFFDFQNGILFHCLRDQVLEFHSGGMKQIKRLDLLGRDRLFLPQIRFLHHVLREIRHKFYNIRDSSLSTCSENSFNAC